MYACIRTSISKGSALLFLLFSVDESSSPRAGTAQSLGLGRASLPRARNDAEEYGRKVAPRPGRMKLFRARAQWAWVSCPEGLRCFTLVS